MSTVATVSQTSQNVTLPSIPELFRSDYLDVLIPPAPSQPVAPVAAEKDAPTNPMMDVLNTAANRAYTANMAQAYDSTGSPLLDAFNNLAQWSDNESIESHLTKAWAEDPDLTLKLIWNLRSIHDGKSAKEAFYKAFGWLYKHHPRTAIINLRLLVEPVCKNKKTKEGEGTAHGYWKDLLNILALATLDQLSAEHSTFLHKPREPFTYKYRRGKVVKTGTSQERIEQSLARDASKKTEAKKARAERRATNHQILVEKLKQPKYRALYIAVARLFSERLTEDLNAYLELERLPSDASNDARYALLHRMSLAGKWAPTPSLSHDEVTNISTAVSILLHHNRDRLPGYVFPSCLTNAVDLSNPEHAHTLRSFLQRHILTPLRKVTRIPEPLMAANKWKEINYSRVPSVCMKNNKERFMTHDAHGFEQYLISVEEGKRKISGATLLPHELVVEAYQGVANQYADRGKFPALAEAKKRIAEMQLRVVEAQWDSLRKNLQESGALDDCLAICDVSGSMGSLEGRASKNHPQPVQVAVALSLLVAQLAKPPFANSFITFSGNPEVVRLDPTLGLGKTVLSMQSASWGMNTDFNAVFLKLLLPLAKQNNIKQEDMIKRLFVFSDMQFDAALQGSPDQWATNYDVIEKAFKEAGYQVPQIVFWNIQGYDGWSTVEVQADREGVAMMSGFSPAMLKTFMGEELEEGEEEWVDVGEKKANAKEEFNPVSVMKKALGKESFARLRVVN